MAEDKAGFIQAVGEALKNYSREPVQKAEYIIDHGIEFARITFENGEIMHICINGDSCIAILTDLYKGLQ